MITEKDLIFCERFAKKNELSKDFELFLCKFLLEYLESQKRTEEITRYKLYPIKIKN